MCALEEDGAFRLYGECYQTQNPRSRVEINLKKRESRDHVGMKMTHEWKSFYTNVHLSLHRHVLMSRQLKESLKSKGGNLTYLITVDIMEIRHHGLG